MTGDRESLLAQAADHGGVLLTAHAAAGGWTRDRLQYRLRRDGWTRIHRGAWAEPGRVVDTALRVRAVQLDRPELVVSHRSAARVHGIELLAEAMEFTGPGKLRPELHGGILHRLPLAESEVTSMAGLRLTTVPRTLADLLRSVSRDEALVAVESALAQRPLPGAPWVPRPSLVGISDIAGALRADPGRAGTAEAERHLALARAASGSPAETLARLRMHEADLHPELQAWLVTPTGRRVRPDFLFRAEGLVVEIEGYAWHGTREAHRNDVLRFNELGACREVRRTLRFTAVDVYRCPERLIETIRAALTALRDQEGRG